MTCRVAMLMIGVLLGALIGPLTAGEAPAGPVIPETSWELESVSSWSPDELDALGSLALRLPEKLRRPSRPLRVRRRPAPSLSPDPLTPHTLIRNTRGPMLELEIDGLDARVSAWAASLPLERRPPDLPAFTRQLIQRQWVHALVDRADQTYHWSSSSDWRRLAGWSRAMLHQAPAERHAATFASVYGRASPREDLATLAEAWFVPSSSASLPPDLQPRCRMPSKWRFLREHLGIPPALEPAVDCSSLEQVGLDPDQVDFLELLYISSTLSSAASIAGHVLVGIQYRPDALGIVRHDAYGLVAETAGLEGGPRYMWLGLSGGFTSIIMWERFEQTLLRYSEGENRDVRRYRLRLDEAQKRVALSRLDELRQGWDRPYYFAQRNCTQLPIELLEPILGPTFRPPALISPDMLMAMVDRLGLLEPLPVRRPQELALGDRALMAERLRHAGGRQLIQQNPAIALPLRRALDQVQQGDQAARLSGYAALGALAPRLETAGDSLPVLARFLAWSDPVEQARHLEARRRGRYEPEPAIDAIRAAGADVRERARASGAVMPAPGIAQQTLIDALRRPHDDASAHTSFQPIQLLPTVIVTPSQRGVYITLGGALYEYRMGDPRRYGLSEGMELLLLRSELQLGASLAGRLRARVGAFSLSYLKSGNSPLRFGGYWNLIDLEYVHEDSDRLRAHWLGGGSLISLWQVNHYRHYLNLRAGLELGSDWQLAPPHPLSGAVQVEAPIGLEARIGSRRQPLTAFRAMGSWRPGLSSRSGLEQAVEVGAQLRGRVGEVSGVDVALGGEYRGRWEAALPGIPSLGEQQLSVGIWLERF